MAFWLTLEDARLFYVNSTGAKRMGYTQEEMVGMQISQIDPEFPAERWPEFADRLRSGEPLVFESTHKTRDGQRYPVEITAQYVEFGDEKQVIAFARDITDRKRDQEELANMSMEASLLYRSTRIAEEASTFNDTLQGVVKIFCEIIGWPVGHVYLISDDDETLLEPTDIWHLDDPESYTKFHEVTQRTTFKIGEGLPGRILESTKPAWIVNVQTDPNFPRNQKATSIEVKGAFGFPIKVQGKVFAVCEFFALEEMESNPHFLSLAGPVGDQIGRIFERKLAQQEVASQNAIIKTIMENMNQGILMVDRDMNIVTSNPGFDEILGIDADWRDRFSTYREIVTYFYEEIVGAENAAEIIERAVDIVRSGNTMVHEQEIQDGRFMEMRQTKLDDGGVVRTYTDTTDRKQAEEILRESEERLLAMLDGSPVGVRIVRDSDSIIIFANARMEELFHLSKEDFLGTKTGDYHVDLNNQEAIVARFRKEGFVRDAEVQMKRPDGGTFWALLSIAPFEYEGEPARLVWFYEITKLKETEEKLLEARSELESRVEERTQELRREIVERQNAEEKLRNAEKMQALGTLAGGIAHNFNNALVPIIALSGIVQRKIPKENPNHEMLGKIAEGAERAQDLVAQIMSFSRQDESKLENVDATALV